MQSNRCFSLVSMIGAFALFCYILPIQGNAMLRSTSAVAQKDSRSVSYRIATLSDIPAINQIVHHSYRGQDGWTNESELVAGVRTTEGQLQEIISSPETQKVILVLLEKGEVVGSVCLENQSGVAHLGMLAVNPYLQNSGFGRALIEAAGEWASSQWESKEIQLEVIQGRIELIAWYQRRGFVLMENVIEFSEIAPGIQTLVPNLKLLTMKKSLSLI